MIYSVSGVLQLLLIYFVWYSGGHQGIWVHSIYHSNNCDDCQPASSSARPGGAATHKWVPYCHHHPQLILVQCRTKAIPNILISLPEVCVLHSSPANATNQSLWWVLVCLSFSHISWVATIILVVYLLLLLCMIWPSKVHFFFLLISRMSSAFFLFPNL